MTAVQSACLVHCLERHDGRIAREIAHEMWRQVGSPEDNDDIPADAVVEVFRSESSGSE
ncbi:MAG: hypothetical protein JWP46_355 [Modestobacter sp.]|jgi:hypothetical protein|nr:hypothetical protein [Modestobacter sp.]